MISKPVKKFLITSVSIATAAILGGGLLLWYMQDRLIYFPAVPDQFPSSNPHGYREPIEAGLSFEDVNIKTSDNINLHGWLVKTKTPEESPTVVIFQGNAGNIGYRIPFLRSLNQECNVNALIVAYRGYSYSEGKPTEKGLQQDSIAIMDHVFSRRDIDTNKIFVIGSSLGGAVGVYALSRGKAYNVAGLILENTFTSMADMVDQVMPAVSRLKGLVLANHWESIDRIGKIKAPILFISGLKDELVPPKQMQRLYDAANNSMFKDKIGVESGTHNDTWYEGGRALFKKLVEFMETAIVMKNKQPKL